MTWTKVWESVGAALIGWHYFNFCATELSSGDIYALEGTYYDKNLKKDIHKWKKIGGPGKKFVNDYHFLYRLSPNGDKVEMNLAHQGKPTQWLAIRNEPTDDIYCGPTGLVIKPSINKIGNTKLFQHPNIEKLLGGPTKDLPLAVGGVVGEFAQAERHLICIHPNSMEVYKYNFDPNKPFAWTSLGGPGKDASAGKIYAGGSRFYATHKGTGDIYLYKQAKIWEKIGGPGFMFAVDQFSGKLYRLSPSKDKVEVWTDKTGIWDQVGGPAESIFAGPPRNLLATNSKNELWATQLP